MAFHVLLAFLGTIARGSTIVLELYLMVELYTESFYPSGVLTRWMCSHTWPLSSVCWRGRWRR